MLAAKEKPAAKRKVILRISVEFGDGCLQVGDFQVGIDHRRLNVVVAEQELDVPDARPSSQQVRRAAMAEEVYVGLHIESARIALDDLLEHRV